MKEKMRIQMELAEPFQLKDVEGRANLKVPNDWTAYLSQSQKDPAFENMMNPKMVVQGFQ